jgi:NTE family protein
LTDTALVLAGGGVAGIAWELGYLLGVRDRSDRTARALLDADLVIGTSAGSTVAAQITSGSTLADLYATQLSTTSAEIDPGVDLEQLTASFAFASPDASIADRLRTIASMATEASTVTAEVRRAVIAARLPSHRWPNRELKITAHDTDTGDLVVFGRDSGVGLVDAVAASCAVPGVWPVVTIDSRRYMDGGVASSTNTALAHGSSKIVVLVPSPEPGAFLLGGSVADEVSTLVGSSVHTVFADDASVAAIGINALDPATRPPSARAGREQGARDAAALSAFLGIPL